MKNKIVKKTPIKFLIFGFQTKKGRAVCYTQGQSYVFLQKKQNCHKYFFISSKDDQNIIYLG